MPAISVAAPAVVLPDAAIVSPEIVEAESFENDVVASDPIDFKSNWPAFLDLVSRDRPNLGSFLSLAYIASHTAASVDLKFSPAYRFQFLEVTKTVSRDEITRMLREFAGAPIEVRISLETKKPETEGQNYIKQVANIAASIDDQIENEPIIKTILDMFDGEVIN